MIKGKFITTKTKVNTFKGVKKFNVSFISDAKLNITSLGLYVCFLNGRRVGDCYLTPGWTSYNKMLQVQSYNIKDYLVVGENTLEVICNDGWYAGSLTNYMFTGFYGLKCAFACDLVLDEDIISSDESFRVYESFITFSGIYEGETADYTKKLKELEIDFVEFDRQNLVPQIVEPVRNHEKFPVQQIIETKDGKVFDFGQNLAGVATIRTPENFDGTIKVRYAEILVGNEFYTDNLRKALSTDTFTVRGAKELCAEFTYHGFRYVLVEGIDLNREDITAIARYTDMQESGSIISSNKRLNRLMKNILWGEKSNFVDIPTDCPQRDERLGWSGDINAFISSASFYYDTRRIIKKYLADLRNDQAPDGNLPFIAPNCLPDHTTSAMWSDVIWMVPWKMYCMYGDISYLKDNYEAILKFISAREQRFENGLIRKGFEFGDWLALDREIVSDGSTGRTDVYFLANAFQYKAYLTLCQIEKILDVKSDNNFEDKARQLLTAMQEEYFTSTGRFTESTITGYTIALAFGIVPEKFEELTAKLLNEQVVHHRFAMITGFIGSAYLLDTLTKYGYFETARRVLFNNGYPGWFYEIDMGATTIWERWNSLEPDGQPNKDNMNSYNHYAYGSVLEFIVKDIAGLDYSEIGLKKVSFKPHTAKGIESISIHYHNEDGEFTCGYNYENGRVHYHLNVPDGYKVQCIIDGETAIMNNSTQFDCVRASEPLKESAFNLSSTMGELRGNPKAFRIFNEAFDGLFTNRLILWTNNERTLKFITEACEREHVMTAKEAEERISRSAEKFEDDI